MNLIIRNAIIVDPDNAHHNKMVDIHIVDGVIKGLGKSLEVSSETTEIKFDNLHVSKGWFDSSVSLGEPGFEERETITNGLMVAAKSGFTAIALQPNNNPIADNQANINFLISKSASAATTVYPIGALTKESAGKDLAELFDMKNAGAVAFGDYKKSTENAGLMKIALQYVQDFDGLVIAFSQNSQLAGNGMAAEGEAATRLGLKGIPALAEEADIAKNIQILEYTGGKLHIPTISSAGSVAIIKAAKAKGLAITCSVAVHNLVLTDESLQRFDTRFKVSPPLRTEADRQALIEGVIDGTIDLITSDHNPLDIENKKMEFALAKNGTIGLESAFGALLTVLPLEIVIQKLTAGRNIFNLDESDIKEGSVADITLFTPESNYTFTKEHILSKSKNSAFLGRELQGKVYGIINNGKFVLSNN